ALLHVLLGLAPALGLRLHVLHVDHGLRPDSARDAEYVRALGARLGVPVEVVGVRVAAGSVEAAARAARHAALEAAADRLGAARIALGHTADDQAETLIMRLLEGTGVRGMAGIPPVRGRLIRPLLESRHRDAVAALVAAGIEWREDPSNHEPRFFRNRVRHALLPRLAHQTGGHRGLRRVLAEPPPRRPFRLGGVLVEVSGDRVRVGLTRAPALTQRELAVPGRVELPEIGRALEAVIVSAADYALPRERDRVAF